MKQVAPPSCLKNAFDKHGLDHIKVLEFPDGTRSAADAASAIGCDISDIGKSLVFMTERHKPILIIMNGADQVDEKRVAGLIGGLSIRKATADDVRTSTGYAIGGVPPFGHVGPVETLIDEKLLSKKTIWLAAGTPKTVFAMPPDELRRVTGVETGVSISA
ncbi:YbaK/EbsC family protein [Thalassospira lucentensis]|uniref:YbaK/EbsC family protein n=1 Tax=Thalassospira lucentensis TaxID=168935 RepID=UPI002943E6DE|nr:YbaK/EbsC family protein [Thalassospira lucentensis]WOI09296.1 YbaK/EbsC family protein [Thalassospira lucentensis]